MLTTLQLLAANLVSPFLHYNPVLQAAISPQILAVHVLDKALQSPLSTGFGTGGLWKQLVSTWSTARGKRLSHCQESEELQYESTIQKPADE